MALFEKKDDVFRLMEKFEKSSIAELELEIGADLKIRLSKNAVNHAPQVNVAAAAAAVSTAVIEPEAADYKTINAPIIGTFYSSPSPDSAPYIKTGDKIKKGAVACIIEAMKVMNEIECEQDCEIIEILVSNGELVEYGQPLFKIK